MNSSIYQAQLLLYRWLSHFDKRSYHSIKEICEYLNASMHLEILGNPMWALFYPLLRNGVVDCAGNDYYAIASQVVLDFNTHLYAVNDGNFDDKICVGYNRIERRDINESHNVLRLSTLALLKSFPSIEEVVLGWNNSIQDESVLKYHNKHIKAGIAELINGTSRYFVIPSKSILKELPGRHINPDAYNIAVCYERSIGNDYNGIYTKSHELRMNSFGLPFLLYRALMIDGLSIQKFPTEVNGMVIFYNISKIVIKELNRILCNSIVYE